MSGILSGPLDASGPRRQAKKWPNCAATKGTVVRHRSSGTVGKIVKFAGTQVTLRDANGREHVIPVAAGAFSVEGKTVTLVRPAPKAKPAQVGETASGSVPAPNVGARVARPSRIMVEGIHDAELVEKVWGDDLRAEGVVVEPLHGADDLSAIVTEFDPNPERRLGVLLDHLIANTKESRIAAQVDHPDVLICGHPYVDIWESIRPEVVGLTAWPRIPMGTDWKQGICDHLGFTGTPGELWTALLARVTSFRELEPGLVGAVEQLIDFVAPPPED